LASGGAKDHDRATFGPLDAGRIVTLRMRPMSLAERGLATPTVGLADLLTGRRPAVDDSSKLSLPDYAEEIVRSGSGGDGPQPATPIRRRVCAHMICASGHAEQLGVQSRQPREVG
jgi:hypothetical protein